MKSKNSATWFSSPPVHRWEAIWLDGRIPNRYWDRLENRRLYLHWLGQKLGFRKVEDWYRLTTRDFYQNRGGNSLQAHWGFSVVAAVKECFPDHDWKEWLFHCVPRHFWQNPINRRRYMRWLGQELGIRRPSDWYKVSYHDFAAHNGGGLLVVVFDSTISRAVMEYLPNYDWKEWMFEKTPMRFWRKKANRRRYMTWLGKRLGFKSMQDWYAVHCVDFVANYGGEFLKFYHQSPVAALRDCFPRYSWKEWMFARVPAGYWDKPENRKRYVQWVAKKLKIKTPDDWKNVRRSALLASCAGGLFQGRCSYPDLLRECVR